MKNFTAALFTAIRAFSASAANLLVAPIGEFIRIQASAMVNKSIIITLALFFLANTARALDCRGVWVGNDQRPFMLKDRLGDPYAKWVEGVDPTFIPCPSNLKKIDPTDFH